MRDKERKRQTHTHTIHAFTWCLAVCTSLALAGTNYRNTAGEYVKGPGKGKRGETFHARVSDNIRSELQRK